MAKKKKSGKKKSASSSRGATPVAGMEGGAINTEGMTKDQMEEQWKRTKDDLENERADRNYFQLERDKIAQFWEISKKQLEERRAELRNKDREMEEMEERHQVEIKVYKQKVKHLLYEHQNNVSELKSDNTMALKSEQDDHRGIEIELRKDKRSLKLELKELELAHEDVIKNLKKEHNKQITKLRQEFERQARELHRKYDRKTKLLREELELRRKNEIHEIEERKNGQINTLMKNHEKAFGDIKNYYNDITLNNLALINSLKEQVEEMKKKEDRSEKLMIEITNENKRLTEPLNKALAEVDELRRQLANYEKDKASLGISKARLKLQDEQLKALTWEHEVLQQRFSQVQRERDEVYDKFVATIYDVQQKSGFKNLLLEKKLHALTDQLEKKEAQLNEVLAASNLDPAALSAVTRKLEDVLNAKNSAIKDLQYELARVAKAHNDVIGTYEAKLAEFGIRSEELGFQPLTTRTTVGLGPAGLVVSN